MKSKITFSEWEQIGKQAGWITQADPQSKKAASSVSRMLKKAVQEDADDSPFPFTDDELFALKSSSIGYELVGRDQISLAPRVSVQKNADFDFGVYNKVTQEYEDVKDFNAALALVKKWNAEPSMN